MTVLWNIVDTMPSAVSAHSMLYETTAQNVVQAVTLLLSWLQTSQSILCFKVDKSRTAT